MLRNIAIAILAWLPLAAGGQSLSGASFTRPVQLSYGWDLAVASDSAKAHSPKKATIMSAVVPGLGQVYNRKYWKVAIIYGGLVGLGYGYRFNTDSMDSYQNALNARIDDDTNTVDLKYPFDSDTKITQERNFYRKNRDRIIIGFIALYALQVLDANVDAHLREFEINEYLSLSADPEFTYHPAVGFQPGIHVALKF